MRCLIVGAGPSGLVAARYLHPSYKICVCDCGSEIGGLWRYTPLTDDTTPSDDLFKRLYGHQHASMYEGMKVNIPIEATHAEDFPYEKGKRSSYPDREELKRYLDNYAERYALRELIRLNTAVERIHVLPDQTFIATLRDSKGEETREMYEKVVIANGHYSVPYIPHIEGQETFPGRIEHSHNFRHFPSHLYANQRLLLIGGGSSAWDILKLSMSTCPDILQVILSVKETRFCVLETITDPEFLALKTIGKIRVIGEVIHINGKSVVCMDGEAIDVDHIILCTGYRFSFPFLPEIEVTEDGEYVKDFYKGVFWLKNPNLAMIGVHRGVLFLKLELVSKWLARDFHLTPPISDWRNSLQQEEALILSQGKSLSSLYTQVDTPLSIVAYFQEVGLDYDRNYVEKCEQLFRKTRENIRKYFFTYKEFDLSMDI